MQCYNVTLNSDISMRPVWQNSQQLHSAAIFHHQYHQCPNFGCDCIAALLCRDIYQTGHGKVHTCTRVFVVWVCVENLLQISADSRAAISTAALSTSLRRKTHPECIFIWSAWIIWRRICDTEVPKQASVTLGGNKPLIAVVYSHTHYSKYVKLFHSLLFIQFTIKENT